MSKLECFIDPAHDFEVRAARHERDWMEQTDARFANRCLPLKIANAYGWDLVNPTGCTAIWKGGDGRDDVVVLPDNAQCLASSHFGHGILTFSVPCLFRTPPGIDLWVGGPANLFKPDAQAMTAVVETDWSPFSFTMNWQMMTPGSFVRFEKGEPFGTIFPLGRGTIESFEPVFRHPSDAEELTRSHLQWSQSRAGFLDALDQTGSDAQKQGWQKSYVRGPDTPLDPPHRTRLRLRDFRWGND